MFNERYLYIILSLLYFLLGFKDNADTIYTNIFISSALIIIIIYHFIYSSIKNTVYKKRILRKNYSPTGKTQKLIRIGLWKVAVIYFIYMLVLFLMCKIKLFNWSTFLTISFILLFTDNIFRLKICLIKEWIFKKSNTVNCCMNCYIAGWDNILIFSVLIFQIIYVKLNTFNLILTLLILFSSLAEFLTWEYIVYRYPERITPITNLYLSCKLCQKKCCGTEKRKF